jgi:hypothetical protein
LLAHLEKIAALVSPKVFTGPFRSARHAEADVGFKGSPFVPGNGSTRRALPAPLDWSGPGAPPMPGFSPALRFAVSFTPVGGRSPRTGGGAPPTGGRR